MLTELGRAQVGGSTGLAMLVVTAHARFYLSRKSIGRRHAVMLAVLPVVAPGATVIAPLPVRLKLSGIVGPAHRQVLHHS